MDTDRYYRAPWGQQLRLMTNITILLLIGVPIAVGIALSLSPKSPPEAWFGVAIPLTLLVASVPFGIRGYTLSGTRLIVHRFGWKHSVDLSSLERVTVDPKAFTGAVKLFGNDGLFSISGRFSSRSLGKFQVTASDPRLAVVLRFPTWTLLVTPEYPYEFADDIHTRVPGCKVERVDS